MGKRAEIVNTLGEMSRYCVLVAIISGIYEHHLIGNDAALSHPWWESSAIFCGMGLVLTIIYIVIMVKDPNLRG